MHGLAENTLHVTTNKPQKNSDFLSLSKKSLTKGMVLSIAGRTGSVQMILSAGTLHPEHEVVVG